MGGIIILSFLFIGFVIYCLLIYLPIRWAKKRGMSGRKRFYIGIVSFLVVSALFFGKNLISYTAFRYYCENEAGMTVYKTVEQWKAENPGVWETLKQVDDFRDYQDRDKYPDVALEKEFNGKIYKVTWDGNQRIVLYSMTEYIFWSALDVNSFILLDNKTQEILADYHYFQWTNTWDTTPGYGGRRGISYLGEEICKPNRSDFFEYARSFSNSSLTQEEKSNE